MPARAQPIAEPPHHDLGAAAERAEVVNEEDSHAACALFREAHAIGARQVAMAIEVESPGALGAVAGAGGEADRLPERVDHQRDSEQRPDARSAPGLRVATAAAAASARRRRRGNEGLAST